MADQTTTIPKGWKMTTLGEVAEFQRGFDLPTQDRIQGKYPLIASTGIDGFVKDYKVIAPGVVTGRSGSLGKVLFIKENYWPLNTTLWIKDFKDNDAKFIYYWLLDFPFQKYNAGTGVPTLNRNHIHQVEVVLPKDSEEQRAIAAVLSSLDDKIELLREENKTLEATAQVIFKEWFVKFNFPNSEGKPYKASGGTMIDSDLGQIPEGWRVGRLTEIFDFMEGPGIRNWQYTETGRRFINIRLIQNSDIDIKNANFISLEEAEGVYKHFNLEEKDMVVSTSGTLGRSAIVRKEHLPLMLNTSVIRFRPIDRISYGFMYQFLNSRFFQNELLSMASGSVQLNFGPVHLKQIKMVIPNEKILQLYAKIANSLYIKISNNFSQIQTLSTLRDTLLPKLMKGEIRVKGFGE